MDENKKDITAIHEDNGKRIIIHDIPFTVDDEGDEIFKIEDMVSQFEKGNWDYIDEEKEATE